MDLDKLICKYLCEYYVLERIIESVTSREVLMNCTHIPWARTSSGSLF